MPTEAIIGAFIAMAAAMSAMWISLKSDHDMIVSKQKECEQDREELHQEVSKLRELVGALRLCNQPQCPVHRAFNQG